jgi:hypothetical protein
VKLVRIRLFCHKKQLSATFWSGGLTHRLMIIHGTPTYQISLIYRKRQKGYDSDIITLKTYQLFDLKVKGSGIRVPVTVGTRATLVE